MPAGGAPPRPAGPAVAVPGPSNRVDLNRAGGGGSSPLRRMAIRVPSAHPPHTTAAAISVARLGRCQARRDRRGAEGARRRANTASGGAPGCAPPSPPAAGGSAGDPCTAGLPSSPLLGARGLPSSVPSARIWPARALAVGTRSALAACATAPRRSRSRCSSRLWPERALCPSRRWRVAITVSPIATTSATCSPVVSTPVPGPDQPSPERASGSRSVPSPSRWPGVSIRFIVVSCGTTTRRDAEKPQRSGRRSASMTT